MFFFSFLMYALVNWPKITEKEELRVLVVCERGKNEVNKKQ